MKPRLLAALIALTPACGADDTPLLHWRAADTHDDDGANSVDSEAAGDHGGDAAGDNDARPDTNETSGGDPGEAPDAVGDTPATDLDHRRDAPPAIELTGGVSVFETRAPEVDDLVTAGLGARFREGAAVPNPPLLEIDDCQIRAGGGELGFGIDGATLDAGVISIDIADTTYTLTIAPGDGRPEYRSDFAGGPELFGPGDTVSFFAAGGADISAFSGSVTAPQEPVITAPGWTMLSRHDRADPLDIRWQGAGADLLLINLLPIEIFPEPGIALGNTITCTVPDSGAYSVPAAALSHLPEGSGFGGGAVALSVVRLSNATIEGSGSTITLNATASHTIIGSIP